MEDNQENYSTYKPVKVRTNKCIVCGTVYKQIRSHSLFCSRCEIIGGVPVIDAEVDQETMVDIELLKNPTGRTPAKIHE